MVMASLRSDELPVCLPLLSPLSILPRIYGDLLYDCETFRTPSLMSKGTICIRADVGWVAV